MESAETVGNVEIGAVACLGFSISNRDVATHSQVEKSGTVGQSVCCLRMLITLFAAFLCLASFIVIMYISSAFPIDPSSSGRQCSHIATETYLTKLHSDDLYRLERIP